MSREDQSPRKPAAKRERIVAPAPFPSLQRKCACGRSGGAEGECAECRKNKTTLQRSAAGGAEVGNVPPVVHEVLRSPGQPLDHATRDFLEPRFRHDFGKVRIHTDEQAARSAQAVNAAAYTVGRDVAFASGKYAPGTHAGQWLIAHELSHVVQQEGAGSERSASDDGAALKLGGSANRAEHEASQAADTVTDPRRDSTSILHAAQPAVQRQPKQEWDESYYKEARENPQDPRERNVWSHNLKPYEKFKSGIGDIRPTSEGGLAENALGWDKARTENMRFLTAQQGKMAHDKPVMGAGFAVQREITMEQLKACFEQFARDVSSDKGKEKKGEQYLASLNQAFRIMKIDTVEAQSNYLAHAYVESNQFRRFTETQRPDQAWEDDPSKVKIDRSSLGKPFKEGGDEANFIGRGPIQVTFRSGYVEVVAVLEKAAEQYEKVKPEDVKEAWRVAQGARMAADNAQGDQAADSKRSPGSTMPLPAEALQKIARSLENKAYDLQQASGNAKLCREAANAVKADPQQAANPKYTFLISAAFMKKEGADVRIQQDPHTWKGENVAANWVAGGKLPEGSSQEKALPVKSQAYDRIYGVLCDNSDQCKEAKAKKGAQAGAR